MPKCLSASRRSCQLWPYLCRETPVAADCLATVVAQGMKGKGSCDNRLQSRQGAKGMQLFAIAPLKNDWEECFHLNILSGAKPFSFDWGCSPLQHRTVRRRWAMRCQTWLLGCSAAPESRLASPFPSVPITPHQVRLQPSLSQNPWFST